LRASRNAVPDLPQRIIAAQASNNRFWHEANSKSPFTVVLVKAMPIADEL